MLRYNFFYTLLLSTTVVIFKLLNSFNYFISGETIFYDILYRLDVNETLLNSFSFYWTSFFYLPVFFTYLLINGLVYSQANDFKVIMIWIITIPYLIKLFERVNIIALNFNNIIFIEYESTINELLFNNLNRYHPLIFYISTLFLIYTCIIFINTFDLSKLFKKNFIIYTEVYIIRLTLLFNMISLILGGWWALQESTWGGWWNWDSSELFGFLICFYSLTRLHLRHTFNTQSLFYIKYWIGLLLFFLSYISIQLSFIHLSHNFGLESLIVFTSNWFFYPFILGIYITFGFLLVFYWKNIKTTLYFTLRSKIIVRFNRWLLIMLYVMSLFFIITLSYSPLIESYVYSNWSYLVMTSLIIYLIFNCIVISVLCIISRDFFILVPILWVNSICLNPSIFSLIPLITINYCRLRIIHLIFLLIFILNIKSYNTSYALLEDSLFNQMNIENTIIIQPISWSYTCDSFFIQRLVSYRLGNNYFSSFSNLYLSSVYNPNHYILVGDSSSLTNFYFRKLSFFIKYYNIKSTILINLWDSYCFLLVIAIFNRIFIYNRYYY